MRSEKVAEYRRKEHRRFGYIAVFIVICVVLAFYSLSVSKFGVSMEDVFNSIVNHLTGNVPERGIGEQYYIWMLDKVIMKTRWGSPSERRARRHASQTAGDAGNKEVARS